MCKCVPYTDNLNGARLDADRPHPRCHYTAGKLEMEVRELDVRTGTATLISPRSGLRATDSHTDRLLRTARRTGLRRARGALGSGRNDLHHRQTHGWLGLLRVSRLNRTGKGRIHRGSV